MADYKDYYTQEPPPTPEERAAAVERQKLDRKRAFAFIRKLRRLGVNGSALIKITNYGLGIPNNDVMIAYHLDKEYRPDDIDWRVEPVDISHALVNDTVVLDPRKDPYAILAIFEYASITHNDTLRIWARAVCEELEESDD